MPIYYGLYNSIGIDGYMLAGPQWANYMSQVLGLYPAEKFPSPA